MSPKSNTVIFALVIVSGISYSSFSSDNIFFASSIEIANFIPDSSACTSSGFSLKYASCGSHSISSAIFSISIFSGYASFVGISITLSVLLKSFISSMILFFNSSLFIITPFLPFVIINLLSSI